MFPGKWQSHLQSNCIPQLYTLEKYLHTCTRPTRRHLCIPFVGYKYDTFVSALSVRKNTVNNLMVHLQENG